MDKSREYDHPDRKLYGPGVAANHSSESASVESDLTHAQADEALDNVDGIQDPNLSGTAPTRDVYTWLAGSMDGWVENDDYRAYFERSIGCDGMLACDPQDGDYDDNGGHPIGVGHHRGIHGSAASAETRLTTMDYSLGSVIVRRV